MDFSLKNALTSATHSWARSWSSAHSHADCNQGQKTRCKGQQGTYQQEEKCSQADQALQIFSLLPSPKERDHCRGYANILTRILRKFYENLCHIYGSFMPVLHQLLSDEFVSKKWLGTSESAK